MISPDLNRLAARESLARNESNRASVFALLAIYDTLQEILNELKVANEAWLLSNWGRHLGKSVRGPTAGPDIPENAEIAERWIEEYDKKQEKSQDPPGEVTTENAGVPWTGKINAAARE